MVHNYITSKDLIERIYNNYNIQSDDFVSRLPTWVLNAIREIGIKQSYILTNIVLYLKDNKSCIPKEIDRIYGVKINGLTADLNYDLSTVEKQYYSHHYKNEVVGFNGSIYKTEHNAIDDYDEDLVTPDEEKLTQTYPTVISPTDYYNAQYLELNHTNFDIKYWRSRSKDTYKYKIVNGWINTNVKEGTIELACGAIPYLYDQDFEMIFPLIPDDENLIQALTFYILGQMLMRGYKHSLLSYTTNNEFLNPGMGWTKYSKLARNSCNAMSPDSKRTLSKLTGRNII